MSVAIVILAAGASARMGQPKQLLSVGNTTLLGHAIEHAKQSNAAKVFCVLGAYADQIKTSISHYNVDIINNAHFNTGLSSSITKAISYLQNESFDAILIMLSDQPHTDTNYLNALIHSFLNHQNKISASMYADGYGVPAIFPRPYFKDLLELKGDTGAKAFLNAHHTEIIPIKSDTLKDIDTPDDYSNFLDSI